MWLGGRQGDGGGWGVKRKKPYWWRIQTTQLFTGRLHKQRRPTPTSVHHETGDIKSLLNIYLPCQVRHLIAGEGRAPPSPPPLQFNPPSSAPSATSDVKSESHAWVSVIFFLNILALSPTDGSPRDAVQQEVKGCFVFSFFPSIGEQKNDSGGG